MDQCRSTLKDLGASQLTAASVARVIGMMTRHPSAAIDHTSLQANLLFCVVNVLWCQTSLVISTLLPAGHTVLSMQHTCLLDMISVQMSSEISFIPMKHSHSCFNISAQMIVVCPVHFVALLAVLRLTQLLAFG